MPTRLEAQNAVLGGRACGKDGAQKERQRGTGRKAFPASHSRRTRMSVIGRIVPERPIKSVRSATGAKSSEPARVSVAPGYSISSVDCSPAAGVTGSPPLMSFSSRGLRRWLAIPPFRPASRASSDVHSWAEPFKCAALPPFRAISRCLLRSIEANPRSSLPTMPSCEKHCSVAGWPVTRSEVVDQFLSTPLVSDWSQVGSPVQPTCPSRRGASAVAARHFSLNLTIPAIAGSRTE